MQAAVSVFLRMLDIIFLFDQTDIILLKQAVRQQIDIFWERTYHADSCYIIDVLFNRRKRQRNIFPAHFAHDSVQRFHTCLDGLDRITVIFQRKLFV